MPPKQSTAESQAGSGCNTPTSATSQASNTSKSDRKIGETKIKQLWYKPENTSYRETIPKLIYYDELETIRREKPIVDVNDAAVPVVEVGIWERPQKKAVDWTIDDDDDDLAILETKPLPLKKTAVTDTKVGGKPNTTPAKSAGVKRKACDLDPETTSTEVRETASNINTRPVRLSTNHNFTRIRQRLGFTNSFDDIFGTYKVPATSNFLDRYSKSDPQPPIADPDLATVLADRDWSEYFKKHKEHNSRLPEHGRGAVLYKGFPMVEKVVFVLHPNSWTQSWQGKHMHDGHCYWSAIALLIYGSADYWLLVKAEHLWYLETILSNPGHPRFEFYKNMMKMKFESHAYGARGNLYQGTFNIWEALHIPTLWMNQDPCYLTADLYQVFLILYKYDAKERTSQWYNKVYDMTTYGAYNSRHIFLCYTVSLLTPSYQY